MAGFWAKQKIALAPCRVCWVRQEARPHDSRPRDSPVALARYAAAPARIRPGRTLSPERGRRTLHPADCGQRGSRAGPPRSGQRGLRAAHPRTRRRRLPERPVRRSGHRAGAQGRDQRRRRSVYRPYRIPRRTLRIRCASPSPPRIYRCPQSAGRSLLNALRACGVFSITTCASAHPRVRAESACG